MPPQAAKKTLFDDEDQGQFLAPKQREENVIPVKQEPKKKAGLLFGESDEEPVQLKKQPSKPEPVKEAKPSQILKAEEPVAVTRKT